MFVRLTCLVGIWLLTASCVIAQKQINHQQLVWYVYVNSIRFSEKWFWINEVQERRFIVPDAQSQFLFRTHVHRNLGSGWDIGAGACLFLQSANSPEELDPLTVPEIRPHIEVNQKQEVSFGQIDQRFRIESRYFHSTNETHTALAEGYMFGNFRLRYQLIFAVPVWKWKDKRSLKLKVMDEILFNAGKKIVHNSFDQNRLFAGLNADVSPSIAIEAGYMNWFQQQKSGIGYYNRDILRFALYHKIYSKRTP